VDIHLFLEDVNGELMPRTKHLYKQILEELATWLRAKRLRLRDLSRGQFDQFLRDHPEWGNSTQRNALCAVKKYLRWDGQRDHTLLDMKIRHVDPGPQRTPEPEETRALLAALNPKTAAGCRDAAWIILALETGLRASEICRLKVEDLDLEACRLFVYQKGQRPRHAVFPEELAELLREWLTLRKRYAANGTKEVFVSVGGPSPGKPLTRHGLKTILRKLSKKAGVDLISPHALRRAFACDAVRRNVSMRLIMAQGGWKTSTMVTRYTRAISAEDYRGHFGGYLHLINKK